MVITYRKHPDFPGYRIGTDGSVWTSWRLGPNSIRLPTWKRMTGGVISNGYMGIGPRRNGKRYPRKVAHLVLETFVGPRPKGSVCCHLNGDKRDDRLENLIWAHPLVNMEHRDEHGHTVRGERHWKAKLRVKDVQRIRSLLATRSLASLGREYGVCYTTIAAIRDGISWARF